MTTQLPVHLQIDYVHFLMPVRRCRIHIIKNLQVHQIHTQQHFNQHSQMLNQNIPQSQVQPLPPLPQQPSPFSKKPLEVIVFEHRPTNYTQGQFQITVQPTMFTPLVQVSTTKPSLQHVVSHESSQEMSPVESLRV